MTTETINLNKISLTKDQPSISLTKKGDIGTIRVNLNWDEG